jgi:hypothetical protein
LLLKRKIDEQLKIKMKSWHILLIGGGAAILKHFPLDPVLGQPPRHHRYHFGF